MLKGGSPFALALLASLAVARTGAAQTERRQLELRWQAPPECPGDLGFLRDVESFLGGNASLSDDQQLTIDARVFGDSARGYAAKITFVTRDGSTERALEHPDCRKLAEAAALLAALAIDPERVKSRQEGRAEPAPAPAPPAPIVLPPPEPASASTPPRDASPRPPVAAAEPARFALGLSGLVASGLLPSAGPGIGGELSVRWLAWEAGLGGHYWLSRSVLVENAAPASLELSLATAALRLCLAPERNAWSVALCLRGDVGSVSGRGEGVDNARTRSALYAALGGGAIVRYRLGRLSPLLGVEALALGARPRFGVLRDGGEQEVFRPKAWQLTGLLGISYAL